MHPRFLLTNQIKTTRGSGPFSGGPGGPPQTYSCGLEDQAERELQVALGSGHAAGDDSEVAVSAESAGIADADVGLAQHREVGEVDGLATELDIEALGEPE